jgi:hypothetical protein
MSYKHMKNLEGKTGEYILRKTDGAHIPCNEANTDYQEYLEWAKTNTAEAADTETLTWDSIRATRDQILIDTDWTMTTGASVDQAQWAAYRQNIRDIPQTYSGKTPDEVVWPTQPSTAGPNT